MHVTQYTNSKETIEETNSEKDAKYDTKTENQLQTLSLHIKEDSTNFSSKLYAQDKKLSSFTTYYDERLEKMSTRKKFSTNIEIGKTELEARMNMIYDELKYETFISLDMKFQISLRINPLLLMANLLMVSINGHFSSHLKNIHIHPNSSNIYIT